MQLKKLLMYVTVACSLLTGNTLFAQSAPAAKNNIIKFNLTNVALKNYGLQYEHIVNHNQSFGIGFGISPNVSLPFKQTLLDQFGGDEDAKRAIETTTFNKITVTPEYRFYLGKKGAPTGFYIAPFARYTHMQIEQDYAFTPSNNVPHIAHVKGQFDGIGGGILLGAQWALSRSLTLDWFIVGPFAGSMNAKFHGTDDMSDMNAQDKANLKGDIESVDIPLWKVNATVGNNIVDAKLKGPFYGVRAFGINLGYRF
jgi:Protein of unknown function (DUF3575)